MRQRAADVRRWVSDHLLEVIVVAAVVVAGLVAVTSYVNSVDNRFEAEQMARCQNSVEGRAVLRAVVRTATEPGARLPEDLPDDPALDDPDVVRYLENLLRSLNEGVLNADPEHAREARRRLLSEAPPLRCTSDGIPVPVDGD